MQPPSWLPSPIRFLLNHVFFSLLSDGDEFTQVLRKVASALLYIAAPIPLGFASFYAYRAANGAEQYGAQLEPAFGFALGVMLICNYVYVKATRHMSDRHADFVFTFLALDFTLIYMSIPESDPRTCLGAIATASALAQPPHLFLILAYLFGVGVVSIYNEVFQGRGLTLVLFPGPALPTSRAEYLLLELNSMMCLVIAVGGVVAQAAAHVRALAASEAGVRMSNEVVDLLSDYDTEGVEEVLSAYAMQGEVSTSLVLSFRGINRNLEQYRPHLPNYVLMKDEAEEEQLELDYSHSPSERALDSSTIHNDTHSDSSRVTSGSHCTEVRLESARPKQLLGAVGAFRGRITFGLVDLGGLLKGGAVVRDAATAFFDILFQLARTFHGSVHATVGDVATLSWNATRRVVQPELKAAKFLLRLLVAVRSIPNARLASGAVFTGQALCDVVNAHAARQQAMLVSAPWMEALDAAFRLAQWGRCGLVDAETQATASYELETRAIDRVQYVPTDAVEHRRGRRADAWLMFDADEHASSLPRPEAESSLRSSVLYELVSEPRRNDDEWMYQLAQTATQQAASAKVTKAFMEAAQGRYGDCLSLVNDAVPAQRQEGEEVALVSRMKDFCERRLLAR